MGCNLYNNITCDYSYTDKVYTLIDIEYDKDEKLKKIIIQDSESKNREINSYQYFNGWVNLEDVKNVTPDTKINNKFIVCKL